ncbi:MAG: outer membrane protein [Hyphomicrobiales bacterium]
MTIRSQLSAVAAVAALFCVSASMPAVAGGQTTYKGSYKDAPVAGRTIWEGFHVGAHLGWTGVDYGITALGAAPIVAGFGDNDDISGGVLYGSSWQFNNWVLGTDSVWTFSDLDSGIGTTAAALTAQTEINYMSETRARLGYLVTPNVLLFGALGLGVADVDLKGTAVAGGKDGERFYGFSYGGGLEFTTNSRWFGRVEYVHTDYNDEDFVGVAGGLYNVDLDSDTVRGAIGYRFDWSPFDLLRR